MKITVIGTAFAMSVRGQLKFGDPDHKTKHIFINNFFLEKLVTSSIVTAFANITIAE